MVNFNATLLHDFFQVSIRNGISNIKEDSVQNDGPGIVAPFETDHENAPGSVVDAFAEYGTALQTARPILFLRQNHFGRVDALVMGGFRMQDQTVRTRIHLRDPQAQ